MSRLNVLQRFSRVVTVSDCTTVDLGEHLDVNFRLPRGWRKICAFVKEQVSVGRRVDVILDYFFLLDCYWERRYNLDWLSYKIPRLLAAGAARVIVPRTAAMQTMENESLFSAVGVPCNFSDNPLWCATEISGVDSFRGEHLSHTNRLVQGAPFMVYKPSNLVVAGRFAPRRGNQGKHYQLWWMCGTVTWEPRWCIENLHRPFVVEMHRKRGTRVKFTGARRLVDVRIQVASSGSVLTVNCLSNPGLLIVANQKSGSHCALNSVANAIFIPSGLYRELFLIDPPLEEVVFRLSNKVGNIRKVSVPATMLLSWLLVQTTGVFAVEFDAHCITWDCSNNVILDTDPKFPNPMPATESTLALMEVSHALKAYRVSANTKGRRKRLRELHEGIIYILYSYIYMVQLHEGIIYQHKHVHIYMVQLII